MLMAFRMHQPKKQDLNFALDWSNPCNGRWLEGNFTQTYKKYRLNKALRIVKNVAVHEYRSLAVSTSSIDISDMFVWELLNNKYSFLPTLKPNPNIALRSWHRYLQIYTGAFGYLLRASIHADQMNDYFESDDSNVLQKFKLSARKVLCEIESAINVTQTSAATTKRPKRIRRGPIVTVKPDVMLQRLQFQTHFYGLYDPPSTNLTRFDKESYYVDPLDLKFAKQNYFTLLQSISNTLKNHRRFKIKPKPQVQQQNHRKHKQRIRFKA